MNPSFYKSAQAPGGYGTEWLIRLDNAGEAIKGRLNAELRDEEGATHYMELDNEDEARYWLKRFLKINANHFQGFPAYTLLVVAVNLPDKLVTFKQSIYEQGHNAYFDPDTGTVRYYHEDRYEGMSF